MQGSGLLIDEAHSGSMWPYPWIATGDPYYLEALHAKYVMVWYGVGRPVPRAEAGLPPDPADRVAADLAADQRGDDTGEHALVAVAQEPLGDAVGRRDALWDAELVHGTSGGATVFHTVGATAGGAQGGYPLGDLAGGHDPAWSCRGRRCCCRRAVRCAEWKVHDQIARTNGTSGWCRFYPEGYYIDIGPVDRSRFYADWGEAWRENQAQQKVVGPAGSDDAVELG